MKEPKKYVHGYSEKENDRLHDQAGTLAGFLHDDTVYAPGKMILEAGCGVGAQTIFLARNNPRAHILSVDLSPSSLSKARDLIRRNRIRNVEFQAADIFNLPFPDRSFDHVFICFVLEHLSRPVEALQKLKKVLKPQGTITVIEGDHGSTFFYPESEKACRTIRCLIDIQAKLGGDSLIGRRVYPLLEQAGFRNVRVSPRMICVDPGKPFLVKGFTRNTFIAMVEGVKNQALSSGMIDPKTWREGIRDLYKTMKGTFCYTFFKGTGVK
ncbi:MAG: methyltransferase domain-containing protein [bacterium]|nr:methyltransferase domain-containing protein [bacterium]